MSTTSKAEVQGSKLDVVKFILAFLIVGLAIVGFYYFGEQPMLYRVLGLLGAIAVALTFAVQTERGRGTLSFLKDVQVEVRKVVWPTRQETTHSTLLVMAMVVVVAIFLWVLDIFLSWGVRLVTGQGG